MAWRYSNWFWRLSHTAHGHTYTYKHKHIQTHTKGFLSCDVSRRSSCLDRPETSVRHPSVSLRPYWNRSLSLSLSLFLSLISVHPMRYSRDRESACRRGLRSQLPARHRRPSTSFLYVYRCHDSLQWFRSEIREKNYNSSKETVQSDISRSILPVVTGIILIQ